MTSYPDVSRLKSSFSHFIPAAMTGVLARISLLSIRIRSQWRMENSLEFRSRTSRLETSRL